MKKVLFILVAFLAMHAKISAEENENPDVSGQTSLTLNASGYAGTNLYVTNLQSGRTVEWTLETSGQTGTFYIWPSYGTGANAEVSIYSNTPGIIRVLVEVYNGSTLKGTNYVYISYQ